MLKYLFLVMLAATTAFADGTYKTTLDNEEVKIEFVIGPFSPGVCGTAFVYADGVEVASYGYCEYNYGCSTKYVVNGLCTFIDYKGELTAYKDLGITLNK